MMPCRTINSTRAKNKVVQKLHYAHTDLRRRNKATYLQDQENDRNNLNENIERNNLGNEV